VVNNYILK